MNVLSRVLICCVCLVLMSCGGTPVRQFVLEPVLDHANDSIAPALSAVALAEVMLPEYATETRIASRDTRYQITYEETAKWAEPPTDAITRVLANRLRYYLEANVVVEPWPRGYEPQARIEVQFDKLLREVTGGAEISGQIRVISGDGKSMIHVQTFQFLRYAKSRDPNAFFAALSAGVNDVSRMAADILRAHTNPGNT